MTIFLETGIWQDLGFASTREKNLNSSGKIWNINKFRRDFVLQFLMFRILCHLMKKILGRVLVIYYEYNRREVTESEAQQLATRMLNYRVTLLSSDPIIGRWPYYRVTLLSSDPIIGWPYYQVALEEKNIFALPFPFNFFINRSLFGLLILGEQHFFGIVSRWLQNRNQAPGTCYFVNGPRYLLQVRDLFWMFSKNLFQYFKILLTIPMLKTVIMEMLPLTLFLV